MAYRTASSERSPRRVRASRFWVSMPSRIQHMIYDCLRSFLPQAVLGRAFMPDRANTTSPVVGRELGHASPETVAPLGLGN
jgi:hypothetical protein